MLARGYVIFLDGVKTPADHFAAICLHVTVFELKISCKPRLRETAACSYSECHANTECLLRGSMLLEPTA